MSSSNGAERPVDELLVVRVDDEISQALTGHGGQSYQSPPQPREQALTLVAVLLGYTGDELDSKEEWSCPIAGGRRTVRLESADSPLKRHREGVA
jgi:hypothetical protein